jgi:DNA (cytosine-5)-methyltransferase 1
MASRAPVVLDLFSGAGGLSEGLSACGFDIVAASELHPHPALTFAFNHPGTSVFCGDIRALDPALIEDFCRKRLGRSRLDLVVGGPPCQGFSTAGTKQQHDPRNILFRQFTKFIVHFRPRLFVLENVPGFKKMYGGSAYDEARRAFQELGYVCDDVILNAADYGVPQQRKRFVMVGRLPRVAMKFNWPAPTHSEPSALMPLFKRDVLPRYVSVAEAISDLEFLHGGHEAHFHGRGPLSSFQVARRGGSELVFNHLATKHRPRAVAMMRAIAPGKTISSVPEELRSAKRTMARLSPHEISNAVLALPDDLIHYSQDRILTVREMARIQGFDDDFVFLGKRTSCNTQRRVDVPQYTQVGNAVPPLLGAAIGQALLEALGTDEIDVRAHGVRRELLRDLCGTSGWNGYRLRSSDYNLIRLLDVRGAPISLPIARGEQPVHDAKKKAVIWGRDSFRNAWPTVISRGDSTKRAS